MLDIISAAQKSMFEGLKATVRRHPRLLAGIRGVRAFLRPTQKIPAPPPKPPNLLAGLDPLRPDRRALAAFADLSPTLCDVMMGEFVEIAKILAEVETGDAAGRQLLDYYAIDPSFAACRALNIQYSPPKVGGSTIATTLQQKFDGRIDYVHYISAKGLAFMEWMSERFPELETRANLLRGRWFRVLLAINKALRTTGRRVGVDARKPYVITGVREPIALHLSACFEAWQDNVGLLTVDFVKERLGDTPWHRLCNTWFNDDLKDTFGVDVFGRAFARERGWDIYENDAARVLLIRQENLSRLPDALAALYGLEPNAFTIVLRNVAKEKRYAGRYEAVTQAFQLSEDQIQTIYSSPYVAHFYTLEEIAAFKRRWQEGNGARTAA